MRVILLTAVKSLLRKGPTNNLSLPTADVEILRKYIVVEITRFGILMRPIIQQVKVCLQE